MVKESDRDHFGLKIPFLASIENGVMYETSWTSEACLSKLFFGGVDDTT